MTRTLAKLLATVSLFAATAVPAVAAPLWTADWLPLKQNIVTTNGNQVLFSDVPLHNGDGTESNVLATQITVGVPFTGDSDSFEHQNYSLQLTLTDTASGDSTIMSFSGELDGSFSPAGSSITNTFHAANSVHDDVLGGNHYTVTIGPYVSNGQGTDVGSIYATIAVVTPGAGPDVEQPRDTPEPGTLLLAGMGAALSGLGWYRKRRRNA